MYRIPKNTNKKKFFLKNYILSGLKYDTLFSISYSIFIFILFIFFTKDNEITDVNFNSMIIFLIVFIQFPYTFLFIILGFISRGLIYSLLINKDITKINYIKMSLITMTILLSLFDLLMWIFYPMTLKFYLLLIIIPSIIFFMKNIIIPLLIFHFK